MTLTKRCIVTSGRIVLVTILFSIGACKDAGDVYLPKELVEVMNDAGGWVPLPIPDSKHMPGSIIQVGESGIRWIGDLDSCRYPNEFVKEGNIPKISWTKNAAFGADALLGYKGIEAGPSFNNVSKVILTIDKHSADALNLIALQVWEEKPENRQSVSDVCMNELEKLDRYIITESLILKKAKYSLYDQRGTKLALTVPALKDILDVSGNLKYEVTSEGDLVVDAPTVFGVRRALKVESGFDVLSDQSDPSMEDMADEEIAGLYIKDSS